VEAELEIVEKRVGALVLKVAAAPPFAAICRRGWVSWSLGLFFQRVPQFILYVREKLYIRRRTRASIYRIGRGLGTVLKLYLHIGNEDGCVNHQL
jgi:hypothetical protein